MIRGVAVLGVIAAGALGAQAPAGDTMCTYRSCALLIEPAWNGLAVTRGVGGPRVTNLNFFWPRSVTAAMVRSTHGPAADSVAAFARRALRTRRWAALFTDAGLAAGAVAVAARVRTDAPLRNGAWLAVGAGALLGISVPLQFAADGDLSRAVWWHNARFEVSH